MEAESSRGAGRAAGKAAAFAFGTASMLVEKAMQDGHIKAAGRLGVGEISAALKAFPDAIQADEAGTLFSPTQGEVAADRKTSAFGHHMPSGIVGGRHGVYGPEHGQPAHRSPSELAADRGGVHGPEQGHGHDNNHGRDGHER